MSVKFKQYKDKLYWRKQRNTQHNGRKPKYKTLAMEKLPNFVGVAACVEHAPTSEAPNIRSDAIDPRRRQARPKKEERGLHAQTEGKDSLAREDHESSFSDPRGRYFRQ
jgi:hypothetical protein